MQSDKSHAAIIRLRELCHEVATRGPKNWSPTLLDDVRKQLDVVQDVGESK